MLKCLQLTPSENFKARKFFILQQFSFHKQLKFHSLRVELSMKKYNLGARSLLLLILNSSRHFYQVTCILFVFNHLNIPFLEVQSYETFVVLFYTAAIESFLPDYSTDIDQNSLELEEISI